MPLSASTVIHTRADRKDSFAGVAQPSENRKRIMTECQSIVESRVIMLQLSPLLVIYLWIAAAAAAAAAAVVVG